MRYFINTTKAKNNMTPNKMKKPKSYLLIEKKNFKLKNLFKIDIKAYKLRKSNAF